MALAPGTRIGSYDIVAPLGAGGMGEVYRAKDSQLKREVALKTLPDAVASNPERLARFQREAEVLAALNHANIAHLYGVAEGGGVRALVMELVEGEDLAQIIASRGALPLDEILSYAKQIAEALDFAHERGIVHRDLKPANIKVTPDGGIKVLDFGLAKAVLQSDSGDERSRQLANSPTLTSPAMTQRGVILGTAAYMSPEQAKGKLIDKRTDIWAFGCVLYEMLTGKRAFDGEDVTDSIVAVMSREPTWQALPPTLPGSLSRLLRRCLEKDRSRRLADIRDALFELDEAMQSPRAGQTHSAPLNQSAPSRLAWLFSGVGATLAVVIAVVLLAWPGMNSLPPTLDVSLVHTEGADVSSAHISPDGRRVAYRARRADGLPLIFVRDLMSGESKALTGTHDGWRPFWSPDGRNIGFFVNGSLRRIPVDGGPVQVIASGYSGTDSQHGADWAGDTILFAPSDYQGLMSVPASGGQLKEVTKLPRTDWAHLSPSFLPDGRHFLFTAKLWTQAAEKSEQGIYLGSLDGGEVRRLLPDLSSAVYAPPGYIVFLRDKHAHAVPFDAKTSTITGEPRLISMVDVAWDSTYYAAAISASRSDGTLAIRPEPADLIGRAAGTTQLQWLDRQGHKFPLGEPREFDSFMKVSPDGTRIAAMLIAPDRTTDVYSIDSVSGVPSPITTSHSYAGWPVWSVDGKRMLLDIQPPGSLDDLYIKDFASGALKPVIESRDVGEQPIAWSSNGRLIVFQKTIGRERTVELLDLASNSTINLSKFPSATAAFSPDDRFLAFNSWQSGRVETYVTTLPDRRQTWQLSTDGSRVLSWSRDGKEIAVSTMQGDIAVYPVTTSGDRFEAGLPKTIARGLGSSVVFSSLTSDHSRILVRTDSNASRDHNEIRLLFGWQSRLKLAP